MSYPEYSETIKNVSKETVEPKDRESLLEMSNIRCLLEKGDEKMRVKLNYIVPPVRCFLHHALALGVFWDENDKEIMKWYCVNYNYLMAGHTLEDQFYSFMVNYNSIPFLQKSNICGNELDGLLSRFSFPEIIKFLIDRGNLVEVIADEFYFSMSAAYQKKHFMHEVLILGYDDNKKSFLIRQYINHTFQEKEVSWEEVIPFENGIYYGDDVAMKIYKKKKNNFYFCPEMFMIQIKDFYESANPYQRVGGFYGNDFDTWNKDFGFQAYERIGELFESQEWIDYRVLRMVFEHFDGMKRKLEFIKQEDYEGILIREELIEFYQKSALVMFSLVNMGVKQNLLGEDLRENTKKRIVAKFRELILEERNWMTDFLKINDYL